MFTAPTILPGDPAALQLNLRAALDVVLVLLGAAGVQGGSPIGGGQCFVGRPGMRSRLQIDAHLDDFVGVYVTDAPGALRQRAMTGGEADVCAANHIESSRKQCRPRRRSSVIALHFRAERDASQHHGSNAQKTRCLGS
jgi:hypothetical protein